MGKVKQEKKNKGQSEDQQLRGIQNKQINKKKQNKFANTPAGKVPLLNGDKYHGKNQNKKEKFHPLLNKQKKKDLDENKNVSPKSQKKISQQNSSPGGSQSNKKEIKNKNAKKLTVEQSSDDSEVDDINEGISLEESASDEEDYEVESEEESGNESVPNIFGQSLADDTDEDDSDFKDESEDDGTDENTDMDGNKKKNGVKMFQGLNKKNSKAEKKSKNISKEQEEDDDDDDEDDEEDEDNETESDDDDFNDSQESKLSTSGTEDDDDEEEDDDDDDDDEDEDEDEDDDGDESALGLKDLLGNSIVDDEDDEDFEGEEEEEDDDEDISDEASEAEEDETKVQTADKEQVETEGYTIFVGNLPKDVTTAQLTKEFKQFGPILSVRFRSLPPTKENASKKLTGIKRELHPKINTINAYITFKHEDSATKALSMNGEMFQGNYLRVDNKELKIDGKKSVFLGNLPFLITDNAVWEHFKQCGPIQSVRLIKDKYSRIGKGIGYVNFKNEDSVSLAMELNGSTLGNREIRVKPYTCNNSPKQTKQKRRMRQGRDDTSKKLKRDDTEKVQNKDSQKSKKSKNQFQESSNSSPEGKTNVVFQGEKATIKKKSNKTKLDKKKKILAEKLTAKPKKVAKV